MKKNINVNIFDNLYPMDEDAYEWQESSQGPPRKYYKLTDAGHTLLLQLDGAWRELENTVHLLKDRNLN